MSGSNIRGGKGAGAVVLRKWKLALGLNLKDEGLELKLQVLKMVGMLGFYYLVFLTPPLPVLLSSFYSFDYSIPPLPFP